MRFRLFALVLLLLGGAAGVATAQPAYTYPVGPSLHSFPVWIGGAPASSSVDSLLYLSGTPSGVEYSFYSSSTLPSYFAGNLEAKVVLPKILTVATLPTCNAALFGAMASITDGDDPFDCTLGEGTSDVPCECSGSAWVPRRTTDPDTGNFSVAAGNSSASIANDYTLFTTGESGVEDVNSFATYLNSGASMAHVEHSGGAISRIKIDEDGVIKLDVDEGSAEVSVISGQTSFTGTVLLTVASAPPVACASGKKGSIYFDSDVNKLCVCDGTNYVLVDDATTTTGCS